MVRRDKDSLDAILMKEFFKFRGRKWWAIVADDLSWEPLSSEDTLQGVACAFCSSSFHRTNYFWPFRVCIHHDEIVVGLMTSKVDVYALPGSTGP